ncbi:hypothetical protein FPOA_06529 [Fusarium poae]|uniref:Uncharacterized protein n=1 Tax=Fusarium poae TaxID=36050 RepID=A0A1B8AZT2_FUSPO|nr:hypothetical protein FPOA_06529 [Fusarium poae]
MTSFEPSRESTTLMDQQDSPQSVEMTPHVKTRIPEKSSQPPFWLTKAALLLFVCIFTSCAASLIVLHYFIHARGGLPLKFSSSEYSWTYGPTAILVIILSLWRRIDYYYKSTQPWMELQSGPIPASRSLLLDYISPFQMQSMYRSFRFGHYRVTATIFSFFLLKGVILVSTTLFVVQNSSHFEELDITYENYFDAGKIWTSPPYNLGFVTDNQIPILDGGSDTSVWKYLARLNGAAQNDSAWETKDGLVTRQFRPTESTSNITSIEAPVEVFVPNITCEDATLTAQPYNNYFQYSWNSTTCSTGVATFEFRCSNNKTNEMYCGEKPWHYSLIRANCSNGIDNTEQYVDNLPHDIEEYDIRHVITAAQYSIDLEQVAVANTSESIKLVGYTSIICKIGYSILSTNATYNALSGLATISTEAVIGMGTPLPNLTSPYLAEMLFSNIYKSENALIVNETNLVQTLKSWWQQKQQSQSLFRLMAVRLGGDFEPGMFLNSSVFRKTCLDVLCGLLNELARESLLIGKTSKGTATASVSEPRLCTRAAAVWVMASGFALLACISLVLFFATWRNLWIHAFCGSIAGHAAILSNSPTVQDLLRDSGHSSEKDLVSILEEASFKASTNGSGEFRIEASDNSLSLSATTSKDAAKAKAWVPITGSLSFVIATVTFPVLAMGVLELLQQLSNQRQGLVDMHEDESTGVSYVIRITSTAVAFTIATMFNSLDFTIATFAPYNALRSGSVQADKSILFHLLSVSPFLVLIKSFRAGYAGAATSYIASFLGSFLTIVVSGLWILTGNVLHMKPSTVMVTNWHASWPIDSMDDGGAAVALNLIRHGGANRSLGILEDVVLPDIELAASQTPTFNNVHQSLNYTYKVGALRPFLSCKVIPRENITSNLNRALEDFLDGDIISAHFLAPYDCGDVKVNKMANISFEFKFDLFGDSQWIGQYIELNASAGVSDAECPSVGIFFGQVDNIDTSKWDFTALACSQGIEQIPIDVTFIGNPALRQISEDIPPKLQRDKGWRWVNKTSKSQTLGYRLHRFLTDDLVNFGELEHEIEFDPFFNQLVFGPNGLSKEGLAGSKNVDKLIGAVERDYAEYMRTIIDRNFRATKNTTAELISAEAFPSKLSLSSYKTRISGTSYEYGTRLAIHLTSKIILQILLAAMAVLGLASYLLVKIDGTLPRNPCSIASTMGFLAGSQLCDPSSGIIPKGAEYMSDKELAKVFNGWVFSLGWWHTQRSSEVQSSEYENVDATGSEQEDGAESIQEVSKRFGVDVGCADVAKF